MNTQFLAHLNQFSYIRAEPVYYSPVSDDLASHSAFSYSRHLIDPSARSRWKEILDTPSFFHANFDRERAGKFSIHQQFHKVPKYYICILDTVKTLHVSYIFLYTRICKNTYFLTDTPTKSYSQLPLFQKPTLFRYILKSTESDFLSSKDLFLSFTESKNLNVRSNSLKHLFNHYVVASRLN
jgi:hypothetical protein